MARLLALALAATVVGSLLGVLLPRPAEGSGQWVKFLFTPQAGVSSACLSCGWHDVCTENWNPGPALDFPASCTDTQAVYFRNWGFKASGSTELVGSAEPLTDPYATCKTTEVRIYDMQSNLLGRMYYVHTYRTIAMTIVLYADPGVHKNERVLGGMAKKPWEDGGIPDSEKENQACYDQGLTTGVHLHEESADGASTFLLRDDGDCESDDKYPCGPQETPYAPYDPQDWWNDWARGFCIDDKDCDRFTDSIEQYLGTDPTDACPDGSWDDAWPLDIDKDRVISVTGDVFNYVGRIGTKPGQPGWWQRLDFDADGAISVTGDVFLYVGRIGPDL